MAHYPRGRDWDKPPGEGQGASTGEGSSGGPDDGAPRPSPPGDPGSIAGWSPTTPPSEPAGTEPEPVDPWPPETAPIPTGPPTADEAVPPPGWGASAAIAGEPAAPAASGAVDGSQAPDGTAPPAIGGGGIGGIVRRFWWIGLVAVIVGGGIVFRDRLSGDAGGLKVGECFDIPSDATSDVSDVQHHPCTEAHTAEVFHIYDLTSDETALPSAATLEASIEAECVPQFQSFTGTDIDSQATLSIYYLTPNAEGWDGGDRTIICSIFRVDQGPMTGSMKGTNPQ